MNYKTSALLFCSLLIAHFLFAQNESDFYTETNHLGIVKNLVDDYGANGTDTEDDSEALENAIDELTQLENGGKIVIPAGTFYLSEISMQSNIHIEIESAVTIIPPARTDTKNYKIFKFDSKNTIIKNVSIRGVGARFKVDLRNLENKNVGVFSFGNVENFLIANFDVLDDLTKFSAITFGYTELGDDYNLPENGIVKNGNIRNADYGYGLIQTQAGENVLFKNLSGEGGVTLRLETGYDKMNELQVGGVFNMVARNISCINGNAAIMISPHAIKNGHVEIDTVSAISCGFAVRIGAGYVKKVQEPLGLTPGYFANSSWIKNVSATYGESAQLKSKHFQYMPCTLRDLLTKAPNYSGTVTIYKGPAIAAVLNGAEGDGPGKFKVEISDVTASGFTSQEKSILFEDDTYDCDNLTGNMQKTLQEMVKVFPNPFDKRLNISFPNLHEFEYIQLMDTTGRIIIQQEISMETRDIKLETGKHNLPGGFYVVIVSGKETVIKKKLIKK